MLDTTTAKAVSSCIPYKSCTLDSGVQVAWYQHLKDVPKGVGTLIWGGGGGGLFSIIESVRLYNFQ